MGLCTPNPVTSPGVYTGKATVPGGSSAITGESFALQAPGTTPDGDGGLATGALFIVVSGGPTPAQYNGTAVFLIQDAPGAAVVVSVTEAGSYSVGLPGDGSGNVSCSWADIATAINAFDANLSLEATLTAPDFDGTTVIGAPLTTSVSLGSGRTGVNPVTGTPLPIIDGEHPGGELHISVDADSVHLGNSQVSDATGFQLQSGVDHVIRVPANVALYAEGDDNASGGVSALFIAGRI